MASPRATHVAVADISSDPITSSVNASTGSRTRTPSSTEQLADTVQMLKEYARQETLDPVKTAGKWIGFGVLGAVMIGFATGMLTLGIMRMAQTEWPDAFGGRWMKLLPYLFGLLLCVVVALLALRRINKDPLTKEKR